VETVAAIFRNPRCYPYMSSRNFYITALTNLFVLTLENLIRNQEIGYILSIAGWYMLCNSVWGTQQHGSRGGVWKRKTDQRGLRMFPEGCFILQHRHSWVFKLMELILI